MKFLNKLKNMLYEDEEEETKEIPAKQIYIPKEEVKEVKEEKVVPPTKEIPPIKEFNDDDLAYETYAPEIEKVPREITTKVEVKYDAYPKKRGYNIREKKEDLPLYSGVYKKEEKKFFKPSPIISPVFGIIDDKLTAELRKAKEKEKKEEKETNLPIKEEEKIIDKRETKDKFEDTIYDLRDEKAPKVDKVTVGDAEDYWNELGLEYNTDYKDESTSKVIAENATNQVLEDLNKENEEDSEKTSEVVRKEEKKEEVEDNNDDLFQLINDIYEEGDKE